MMLGVTVDLTTKLQEAVRCRLGSRSIARESPGSSRRPTRTLSGAGAAGPLKRLVRRHLTPSAPWPHPFDSSGAGRMSRTHASKRFLSRPPSDQPSTMGSIPNVTFPMYSSASVGENGCMKGPARTSR